MKKLGMVPVILSIAVIAIACSDNSSSTPDNTTEGVDVSSIDGTTIEPTDKFSYSASSAIDQLSATTSNFFIAPAPSASANISKNSTKQTYTADDCIEGNAQPSTVSFPQDDEMMDTLGSTIPNGDWLACIKVLPLEEGSTESAVYSFTVAGGSNPSFSGTLDTIFGGGEGFASLDFTAFDGFDGNQIRIDSSGNIYFGAYGYNDVEDEDDPEDGHFYMWKMDPLGNADDSFGTDSNGLVDVPYPGGSMGMFWVFNDASILLVAEGPVDDANSAIRMVKLTESGAIDSSFGTSGVVEYNTFDTSEPAAVVADSDGYIYVVGVSYESGEVYSVATIWKFDSSGSIVSDFATDGALRWNDLHATHQSEAVGIEILSDGSILVTGWAKEGWDGLPYTYLWKFDSDGNMISSFGEGGMVETGIQLEPLPITVDADGYIYIGGTPDDESDDSDGYLYKFNSDGTQNSTFSTYTRDGTFFGSQITILNSTLFYAGEEGESGIVAGIDSSSGSSVTDLFTDGFYSITGYLPENVVQDSIGRLVVGAIKSDMSGLRVYRFR
ncbi:MAG: hypothetical protein HN337_04595 [Deltaproteobacteria bacterium]|jgi:uncharacterized delta-60 repeat protein|nr:hypothetical protein [Deltaproteobacteria bacterium]